MRILGHAFVWPASRETLGRFTCCVLAFFILILGNGSVFGAITPEQMKQLQALSSEVKVAGKFFAEGKFVESAEKVTAVQKELMKLLESKDADLQKEARRVYSTLQKAHAMLELEGAELRHCQVGMS